MRPLLYESCAQKITKRFMREIQKNPYYYQTSHGMFILDLLTGYPVKHTALFQRCTNCSLGSHRFQKVFRSLMVFYLVQGEEYGHFFGRDLKNCFLDHQRICKDEIQYILWLNGAGGFPQSGLNQTIVRIKIKSRKRAGDIYGRADTGI